LTLDSALHIDGTIEGEIESSSDISIGGTGNFEGTLHAKHVVVSGYLHGKIECERLEIVATGKVFGEVHSKEFVIESGGQFIGESRIRERDAPIAALRHQIEGEHLDEESAGPHLQEA
jgi:cytoskeletal protein CcmA (bactofilin family)